jgi:hypothetical protein
MTGVRRLGGGVGGHPGSRGGSLRPKTTEVLKVASLSHRQWDKAELPDIL